MIEIECKISFYNNTNQKIVGAKASLVFNDSLKYQTNCDTNGNCYFKVPEKLSQYNAKLYVYEDYQLIESKIKLSKCPYFYLGPNLFISPGPTMIIFKEGIKKYLVNIKVNDGCNSQHLPCLSFKKNALEMVSCEALDVDTSLICYKSFLNYYSTTTIEITGHAWKERHMKNLSLNRAKLIKNYLVKTGIDEQRITIKGAANKYPIFSKINKKEDSLEDQNIKLTKNRKVDFKILSFDYDPILKKITESKNTNNDKNFEEED